MARPTSALRSVLAIASAGVLLTVQVAAAAVVMPPGSIAVPTSGTFLYLNSQPGDWVGDGREQLYTSVDPTFSLFTAKLPIDGELFSATMTQGTHFWSVRLAAPTGQPLRVGSYTGALDLGSRDPMTPGMDISGDGRGCGAQGQFDVNAISYAPTGELLLFDATFEQHCGQYAPGLFGRIRIENPPPTPGVTLPAGTIIVPTAGSFLYVHSDAHDSLGLGVEALFTTPDSKIGGWLLEGPGPYFFHGLVYGSGHRWSVDIAPPPGEALAVGSYISADRATIQRPGHPGLDIGTDGRGCNEVTGKFDVDELSFWFTGEVRTFQSTFEFHCEGRSPALYGRIRVETPQPLPPLDLRVSVDDHGTVDPRTGVATVRGTALCARTAAVTLVGWVNQSLANRASGGAYEFQLECVAPSTAWYATMPPIIGQFTGGPAESHVNAYSCDIYFDPGTCYVGFYGTSFDSTVYFNAGN